MAIYTKANSILKRLKRDESGTAALTWALSMTAIMGAMGAAMDFAVLSSADAKSQAIADTTALAAAIYVKTNGRAPTQEGELTDGDHTAADLGYQYKSLVIDGADGVTVNISYDDDAKEVTTTVYGKTNPILVQVLGITDLEFKSQSVASYLNIADKFPASIALVLDTSGSMAWDDQLAENPYFDSKQGWQGTSPDGAIPRIEGLETSVNTFTSELEDRLGSETDGGQRTVRMGMLPYSSDIVADGVVEMDWGYITPGEVDELEPSGSTNSNPPMAVARTWLEAEEPFHEAEAELHGDTYKDPLKFVIFMSDGQNTVGSYEFTADNTAPVYWRRNGNRWSGIFATDYNNQSGYTRGHLRRTTDALTIASCEAMKEKGVSIYTIGYALDVGAYHDNNSYNNAQYVNLWNQTNAYNLLQTCASDPENFVIASDGAELEAAFDTIQNEIVEELIRLKS